MTLLPILGSTSFLLSPETSLAWYFVMAHWPSAATHPIIETDSLVMTLRVPETPRAFQHLRSTVLRAYALGGDVGLCAQVLLAEIDARDALRRSDDAPATEQAHAG
jgi:hypothetical protein